MSVPSSFNLCMCLIPHAGVSLLYHFSQTVSPEILYRAATCHPCLGITPAPAVISHFPCPTCSCEHSRQPDLIRQRISRKWSGEVSRDVTTAPLPSNLSGCYFFILFLAICKFYLLFFCSRSSSIQAETRHCLFTPLMPMVIHPLP